MKIMVLLGSPRRNKSTGMMADAFAEGARGAGHEVEVIHVGAPNADFRPCIACNWCHGKGEGACVQKDDMQQVLAKLDGTDMIVFATPIYNWAFTPQMHAVVTRFFCRLGKPMPPYYGLIMTSADEDPYKGALYEYEMSVEEAFKGKSLGVVTSHGAENKTEAALARAREFGASLAV